jgi:hypothetical protein
LPNRMAPQNPEYRIPTSASREQMKLMKKQFVGEVFWGLRAG